MTNLGCMVWDTFLEREDRSFFLSYKIRLCVSKGIEFYHSRRGKMYPTGSHWSLGPELIDLMGVSSHITKRHNLTAKSLILWPLQSFYLLFCKVPQAVGTAVFCKWIDLRRADTIYQRCQSKCFIRSLMNMKKGTNRLVFLSLFPVVIRRWIPTLMSLFLYICQWSVYARRVLALILSYSQEMEKGIISKITGIVKRFTVAKLFSVYVVLNVHTVWIESILPLCFSNLVT